MNINELLCANIDHLSKDLNLMLRQRQTSSPGLPTLIRLVLKVSPLNQDKEDLNDTIQSLVLNLALSEENETLEILNLVALFVKGYKDIFKKTDSSEAEISSDEGFITDLIADLEAKLCEENRVADDILDCPEDGLHGVEDEVENEDTTQPEEDSPELNLDQKFLKTVLEHVRHFVSMAGKPAWQIAALDCVTTCLDLLGSTPGQLPGEKQETILPLVHQVWQPLHLLFKSNNIFVVEKAFRCLRVIGEHARDFVHKRTVTDVLPPLLTFFKSLEIMVKERHKQKTLAANQSRRILAEMVSGLWDLLVLLELEPLETDPLIDLLVNHIKDKEGGGGDTTSFLKPKRSLDANILQLKLQHPITS